MQEPHSSKPGGDPDQYHRLSIPAILSILIIYACLILFGVAPAQRTPESLFLLFMSVAGILYTLFIFSVVLPYPWRTHRLRWVMTLINSLGIGLLTIFLSDDLRAIGSVLIILAAVITAMTIGRMPAHLLIFIAAVSYFLHGSRPDSLLLWTLDLAPFLPAAILAETLVRLQAANQAHIRRLETLNNFARQVGSSIETDQVINLLHIAIQRAFTADTYYVAFARNDHLELSLLYDDGEYFYNLTIPLEESLAGRVASTRQPLFIPDLRIEQTSRAVQYSTVGKARINLTWMGAPLIRGENLIGVLAVASYRRQAFEQADFELLQNLAQQASLALDNAAQHTEVVRQSRLDGLTKTYNHGHFLEILRREAESIRNRHGVLGLIMMDIDQFKLYNDQMGHLVGDRVLVALTDAIRLHIKATDSVGRWGGEEFAILLPGTDGLQATQVAERIRATVNALVVDGRDGKPVPSPTVSQGVAIFPSEADEIYRLVDLADQRLYVAKERGRNQVEPGRDHWERMPSPSA
ncbi:MAG: GGDEF domain-containing protein [Anaerolineales bacterium]|nr:GGDEF domain-containing protein [Anaerolineales bacterium]